MRQETQAISIKLFSTCPPSSDGDRASYLRRITDVAQWSERSGCTGMLIYTDNRLVDPWFVAQVVVQNTEALCPLVAVQPVYAHPYTVAKAVASLGYLYDRKICLNMVAGGFKNDLLALNDNTPHDRRYDRLSEYTAIIKALLDGGAPVTFQGAFYSVNALRLSPPIPDALRPDFFISGSSTAGLAAAQSLGATAVMYPKPPQDYAFLEGADSGIRVGIIAREAEAEAWAVAHQRFPSDRKGEIAHQAAMKTSDSVWHRQLSDMAEAPPSEANPYWLVPFKTYKTFCPYLVGSYDRVAEMLARYIGAGFTSFIVDIPPTEEELAHVGEAFSRASHLVLA